MAGFKAGSNIVCPMYGAGTVEEIIKEKIEKNIQDFLKIKLIHSNLELLIPVDMIEPNGIRPISSESQLLRALKILKKDPTKMDDEEAREITANINTIIKGSDIVTCAKWVSKLIYRRRHHGQLNASEKKLYLNFKSLICGELAIIKKMTFKDAEKQLEKVLKKNFSLTDKDIELLGLDDSVDEEETKSAPAEE